MANSKAGAFAAIVAGGVLAYSGIKHRRVIDVITMRQGPSTEPTSASGTAVATSEVASGGAAGSSEGAGKPLVVAAAIEAMHMPTGTYEHSETRPYPPRLYGPPHPVRTDCSGFATLCYKQAGLPDPNGLGYSGQGYTGSLMLKGRTTKTPSPGDLVFFGAPPGHHVAVYVGNGQCIGFGGGSAPSQDSVSSVTQEQAKDYNAGLTTYKTY